MERKTKRIEGAAPGQNVLTFRAADRLAAALSRNCLTSKSNGVFPVLGCLHFNFLFGLLRFWLFRKRYREHALFEAGLDLVRIHAFG
jgi:hypothetical protein